MIFFIDALPFWRAAAVVVLLSLVSDDIDVSSSNSEL